MNCDIKIGRYMKNNNTLLCGVLIGEHKLDKDNFIQEIKERVIEKGFNFTVINTTFCKKPEDFPLHEEFVKWSKYLADNKIYFHLVRTAQKAPAGKISQLEERTVKEMKELAGEYFLGDSIAEPGLAYAAKGEFFLSLNYTPNYVFDNVKDAHDRYIKTVSDLVERNKKIGMPASLSIESTALTKYNIEAGIKFHIIETPNSDPDFIIPSARGAVNNLSDSPFWGALIAHEWYGGMRHEDTLKRKRLNLLTKFLFMHGTRTLMLESGDNYVSAYGHRYEWDSEICKYMRDEIDNFAYYSKNNDRPAASPKVTFGILSGLYDGYAAYSNSSVWAQFGGRREWGHTDAEFSYRLLNCMGSKRRWGDVENYGDYDTSAFPAYGTYDIVPIESSVDNLCKYEYLVMLGWNTMTDENMDKLTEYVRRGGKLLLSGAHLNYSVKREGEFIPPSNEKLEALCGCRYYGEDFSTNFGTKLEYDSINEKHLYPGTKSLACDPIASAGFVDYMRLELTNARRLGFASDNWSKPTNLGETVIENRVGKGTVTFVTSKFYPGNPALTPLYSTFLREFISSSARECETKVIASDKLRYTVYEGNKIYLLNTDYDLPIAVKIIYKDTETLVNLEPLELKTIQL